MLIIPFYKRNRLNHAVSIGLTLYFIGLLFNTYYFVVHGSALQGLVDTVLKVVGSMRNGPCEGLFFVSIGILIYQLQVQGKIKPIVNFVIMVASYIALIVEIILTKDLTHADDHSLFISFITFIPSLFLFLSTLPPLKWDTRVLRNYSTGIYFSHRFFLAIVTLILGVSNSWVTFLLTTTLAIVVLGIMYKVDNKRINMVIK